VSALPFDGEHADAIAECVMLASTDQLGRELERRAGAYLDQAEAAFQVARQSSDPLVVGPAAQAAEASAALCTRMAQAVAAVLSSGDVDACRRAADHARAAHRCASNAAAAWQRCKEEARCACA
jgi:hypothetical protein